MSNPGWAIWVRQSRNILGFRIPGYFGQPPVFSVAGRDNVEIQLGKVDANAGPAQNSVQREDGLDAYVWVKDVDSLYAELKERRANIIEPPQLAGLHELLAGAVVLSAADFLVHVAGQPVGHRNIQLFHGDLPSPF